MYVCGTTGRRFRNRSGAPRIHSTFKTGHDELFIIDRLGQGSYGTVYKCRSRLWGREVALKVENPHLWSTAVEGFSRPPYKKLEYEYRMLQALQGKGYPRVLEYNFSGTYKYIVMEVIVGTSLWGLMDVSLNRRIPRAILCVIAIQLLTYLERIHDSGIIVYDIHGGNVMWTGQEIVMLDPGMAFFYVINGYHIDKSPSQVPYYDKNPTWTCMDDDQFIVPSRRCEIERVLIMILQFLSGRLPWESMVEKRDYERVAAYKRSLTSEQLCNDASSHFMIPAFNHVASLRYKDRPNYNKLRALFHKQLIIEQINRMHQPYLGYR